MKKDSIKKAMEKLTRGKPTVLFALGLAGIALIGLSGILGRGGTKSAQSETVQQKTAGDYAQELEQRLESMLSQMDGVGRVKVMVTLESGYGYVYAKSEKVDNDILEDYKSEDSKKTQEKQTTEETYILVEVNGDEQPLVTQELQPEVRGVVVVCEGGDDPVVASGVTDMVKVALSVSSAKISVVKMSQE